MGSVLIIVAWTVSWCDYVKDNIGDPGRFVANIKSPPQKWWLYAKRCPIVCFLFLCLFVCYLKCILLMAAGAYCIGCSGCTCFGISAGRFFHVFPVDLMGFHKWLVVTSVDYWCSSSVFWSSRLTAEIAVHRLHCNPGQGVVLAGAGGNAPPIVGQFPPEFLRLHLMLKGTDVTVSLLVNKNNGTTPQIFA